MFTYTIMPDYGNAAYAWVKKPGNIANNVGGNIADATGWLGEHSISTELESDFVTWSIEFESQVNNETKRTFHWANFHDRGVALARRLKAELGPNVRVIYEKPMEDPDYATEEIREILPDSSVKSLSSRYGNEPCGTKPSFV